MKVPSNVFFFSPVAVAHWPNGISTLRVTCAVTQENCFILPTYGRQYPPCAIEI